MGSLLFYGARGRTPSSDSPSRASLFTHAPSHNTTAPTHLRGNAVMPSIRALATRAFRRKGAGGILAVLGVAAAVAVIIFPLARWHASLSNSAAGLNEGLSNTSTRLEMVSAMEDRWHQINDMDVAEFKNLTSDKETKYGKFMVKESFGAVGKYNSSTGKCDEGTPGDGDRSCRIATLTVTNEDGSATLGPVQAIRVATADDRIRNLEARATALEGAVATAQSTANTANSNANSALSKFSSYYTKSETYTRAEVNQKLSNGTATFTGYLHYVEGDGIHPSLRVCGITVYPDGGSPYTGCVHIYT